MRRTAVHFTVRLVGVIRDRDHCIALHLMAQHSRYGANRLAPFNHSGHLLVRSRERSMDSCVDLTEGVA